MLIIGGGDSMFPIIYRILCPGVFVAIMSSSIAYKKLKKSIGKIVIN